MTFGVNLASSNMSNAVAMAKAIVEAFNPSTGPAATAGVILDMIEIGNEADLYAQNKLRPAGWNVTVYVAQ